MRKTNIRELWIPIEIDEQWYSRPSVWVEQLRDESKRIATYKERVVSRDGVVSCSRCHRLNTPPQETAPTQGRKKYYEGIGKSPREFLCLIKAGKGSCFVKMSAGMSEVESQVVEKVPSRTWERIK